MKYKHHIATNDGVMIVFDEKTVAVTKEMPCYKECMKRLASHQTSDLSTVISPAARIEKHTGFTIKGDVVYIDSKPTPQRLSEVIIKFVDAHLPVEPIVKFWKNLRGNPSECAAKEDLFDFLQHNSIALTEDGCFLAYKKVKRDLHDVHTGSMLNKIGTRVTMPRDKVCADRNQTCSAGLHVASWDYFESCYTGDGYRTLEVKVNPKDVVSVPVDYQFAKMRVCAYEVVREIHDNKPNAVPLKKEVKTTIKVGNRGRIFLPSPILKAIGVEAKSGVSVNFDAELKRVSITRREVEGGVRYTVTDECNMKIGQNVLRDAGLGKRSSFKVSIIGDEIVIE